MRFVVRSRIRSNGGAVAAASVATAQLISSEFIVCDNWSFYLCFQNGCVAKGRPTKQLQTLTLFYVSTVPTIAFAGNRTRKIDPLWHDESKCIRVYPEDEENILQSSSDRRTCWCYLRQMVCRPILRVKKE